MEIPSFISSSVPQETAQENTSSTESITGLDRNAQITELLHKRNAIIKYMSIVKLSAKLNHELGQVNAKLKELGLNQEDEIRYAKIMKEKVLSGL